MKSDTPIYDKLVREWYARRAKEAYEASPGMIGCGSWELPPEGYERPAFIRTRRSRKR